MLSAKEIEQKRRDIERWSEEIYYSPRYSGESFSTSTPRNRTRNAREGLPVDDC